MNRTECRLKLRKPTVACLTALLLLPKTQQQWPEDCLRLPGISTRDQCRLIITPVTDMAGSGRHVHNQRVCLKRKPLRKQGGCDRTAGTRPVELQAPDQLFSLSTIPGCSPNSI